MNVDTVHPRQGSLIEFPKVVNVLIVEDDFGDYDAVARALRKMDHFEARATRAKTLEAARRLVADNAYDVFLIDYNLGSESGARLLQELGGRASRGVPILLTGLIDRDVQEIALRAGAIGCINKRDLSPTLLETTIRYALYTHRLEAEISTLLRAAASSDTGNGLVRGLRAMAQQMPWLAPAPALGSV
jgi:DNA-binding NarL/FixJ family response regulator